MTYKSNEKSFFYKEREELENIEKKGTKKALKLYDFGASKLRSEIKKHPAQYFFLFISTFLGSVITSSIALFGFSGTIIAQFAAPHLVVRPTEAPKVASAQKVVETEKFDHLLLAQKLRKNESEMVIVDIRSKKDYNAGHIVTSINIPVYGSVLINEEGNLDADSLLASFKEKIKVDSLIIIYGPNSYSSLPSDVATILTVAGKKAKPLAVGWEEWEHLEGN